MSTTELTPLLKRIIRLQEHLPERVKIIGNSGKTLFESTVSTKGVHVNASDGAYAVFISASGVLEVESS